MFSSKIIYILEIKLYMFQIKSKFIKIKAKQDSLLFNIKKDDIYYTCEVLVKVESNYDTQYFLFNDIINDKLKDKTKDPYFCLYDESFINYVFDKLDSDVDSKLYKDLIDLKILKYEAGS